MTAMRRTDPFRELAGLQERMNRIFDDTIGSASRREDEALAATWTPLVDVLEKKDRIAVLTVNRPQVLNALNAATLAEIEADIRKLEGEIQGLLGEVLR